jgi:hypothetical protein
MNERIKKLAEQAEIYAGELIDEGADYDQYPRYYTEKFAQLIVRECMNIARNVGNISEPDDWALDRCYEIEQRIQDRFGVEE